MRQGEARLFVWSKSVANAAKVVDQTGAMRVDEPRQKVRLSGVSGRATWQDVDTPFAKGLLELCLADKLGGGQKNVFVFKSVGSFDTQ